MSGIEDAVSCIVLVVWMAVAEQAGSQRMALRNSLEMDHGEQTI